MCRLIGEASLLAFFTIHGSAPSSIKRDFPTLFPGVVDNKFNKKKKADKSIATWQSNKLYNYCSIAKSFDQIDIRC